MTTPDTEETTPTQDAGRARCETPPSVGGGVLCAVLFLFLLSGASGLIYEVIWTRVLLTVFGATLYAVATVLAAFMGGLALGSLIGGRIADRARRPLAIYGIIEIVIAVAAVLVPTALRLFDPVYRAVYASGDTSFLKLSLIRFALSFAVLLIPTTCMGATLPLLSRFLVRSGGALGARIGGLYAVNTTGAVLGTFLAGFVFIATFGVSGTVLLGAALSTLAGVGALLLSLRLEANVPAGWQATLEQTPEQDVAESPTESISPRLARFVLITYGISGFVALAYQVFWTRALVFRFDYLKNTTYSFSAMLTVFLVGLAVGSAIMAARIDRQRDPVRLYGLLQILIGLSGALSLFMLIYYVHIIPLTDAIDPETNTFDWYRAVFNVFARTVVTIGLPTLLLGMTFPVVARICVRHLGSVGAGIGRLYAVNTLGAILGSFAAGFLLIPLFGLAKGLIVLGLVNVVIGTVILALNPRETPRYKAAWALLAVVAFTVFFLKLPDSFYFQDLQPTHQMIDYAEGPLATVAVDEDAMGYRTIYVDNVGVAGTEPYLLTDQKSLAHVPMLFLENPKSALTVGFGSGGASWSYLQYSELDQVDCIEISRTVPKMAHLLEDSNHGVLREWDGESAIDDQSYHNGRYHVIVDDARSYLRFTDARYDIIATDCTDLRYKSNANLYDVEYFELCKNAITDSGMVVVWMPLAGMSPEVFTCAMRTFSHVFPDMTVWFMNNTPTHYLLLLGTNEPFQINIARMIERIRQPLVRADLEEIALHQPEKVLSCYLGNGPDFQADFDAITLALNTEDSPFLEFESPKFGYGDEPMLMNLELLRRRRGTALPYLEDAAAHPEFVENLKRFEAAVDEILDGHAAYRRIQPLEACERYLAALSISPDDASLQWLLRFEGLRRRAERIPNDIWAELTLGAIERRQQEPALAAEHYGRAMRYAASLRNNSLAAAQGSEYSAAVQAQARENAVQALKFQQKAVLGVAGCYLDLGRHRRGLEFLEQNEELLSTSQDAESLLEELRAALKSVE